MNLIICDDNIFILKKDGTFEYAFFINQDKIESLCLETFQQLIKYIENPRSYIEELEIKNKSYEEALKREEERKKQEEEERIKEEERKRREEEERIKEEERKKQEAKERAYKEWEKIIDEKYQNWKKSEKGIKIIKLNALSSLTTFLSSVIAIVSFIYVNNYETAKIIVQYIHYMSSAFGIIGFIFCFITSFYLEQIKEDIQLDYPFDKYKEKQKIDIE